MGLFTKKDKFSGGKKLLERVNSSHILYAARRNADSSEIIIGREGFISYNDSYVSIICRGKKAFICRDNEVICALLQSGDGIVLSGINGITGVKETVTAYFTSPIRYNR